MGTPGAMTRVGTGTAWAWEPRGHRVTRPVGVRGSGFRIKSGMTEGRGRGIRVGMGSAWAWEPRGHGVARPGGVRGAGFRIESGMTEGRGHGNRVGTGHPTRLDAIPASGKRGRCATLKNGFLGFAVLRCASHRCARNDDVGGWIPDPVRNDRGAGAREPRGHGPPNAPRCHTGIREAGSLRDAEERVPRSAPPRRVFGPPGRVYDFGGLGMTVCGPGGGTAGSRAVKWPAMQVGFPGAWVQRAVASSAAACRSGGRTDPSRSCPGAPGGLQ